MANKYEQRGVSASKSEVHRAISNMDMGLYPNAFCKILPDVAGGDEAFCNLLHADTAGTKTTLAYLYWKETGDASIWKRVAQDALVMNTDDMACVGCIDQLIVSNTIGRNKRLIPGEVLESLIEGTNEFLALMGQWGVNIHHAGGETADVGDVVRTVDVGFTAFARMERAKLIVGEIQAGDVVVGLASYGQAAWENHYNSGIGCNGLTSARHDVLSPFYYSQFPETYDAGIDPAVQYQGSKRMTDKIATPAGDLAVGDLLCSPTRTYLPLLRTVIIEDKLPLHAIIHNTGGGHSKVKRFLRGVRVVKDHLFEPPPIFQLIAEESKSSISELYGVFNMGCRMEIYCPAAAAQILLERAKGLGVDAQIIGYVELSEKEEVEVRTPQEIVVF